MRSIIYLLFLIVNVLWCDAQNNKSIVQGYILKEISNKSDAVLIKNDSLYLIRLNELSAGTFQKEELKTITEIRMQILYATEKYFQYIIEATEYLKEHQKSLSPDDQVQLLTKIKYSYAALNLFVNELEINNQIKTLVNQGANYNLWDYHLDSRVYAKMFNYEAAATSLLVELEKVKNHPEVTNQLIVSGYNDLGYYYYLSGNYEAALSYYNLALTKITSLKNDDLFHTIKGNLGTSLNALGKHSEAKAHLLADIKYLENHQNNIPSLVFNYGILADSYINLKQNDSAKFALKKAGKYLTHYKKSSLGVFFNEKKADYFFAINKLDSAQIYSTLALRLNDSIHRNQITALTRKTRISNEINEGLGNLQKAKIANQQQQIALKTKENNRTILFLIITGIALILLLLNVLRLHKTKKKVIAQNADIQKKASLISENLEEKEILLKEIHHRVKNNLQVISSLLELHNVKTKDPKVKIALNESKNRIQTIALMHTMMYQSESISKINMKKYLSELIEIVKRTFNNKAQNIKIFQQVDKIDVNLKTAVPLSLIIHELLCNCFKYAFNDTTNGQVFLIFGKSADTKELILTVKDNGSGLPENFSVNNSNSIGFDLVQGLTRQLKGELEINSLNGTIVTIKFPGNNND